MYARGRLKSAAGGGRADGFLSAIWRMQALFSRYFAGPKPGLRRVILFDYTANQRTPAWNRVW